MRRMSGAMQSGRLPPLRIEGSPGDVALRRVMSALRWMLPIILLLGLVRPEKASAITQLEKDLKKVSRYMNDGFCEDALRLSQELRKSKEGEKNFDVLFFVLQAQFCLHDVGAALETSQFIKREVNLGAEQEQSLNTFVRNQIEGAFGEVRLSLPADKSANVELSVKKVGALKDPTLEPFYEFVASRSERGIGIPTKIYLPLGTYEIDEVERSLEDFRGIGFVIGKEKLSRRKRAQVGDGQLLGGGYLWLKGFGGSEQPQPDGESVYVDSQRLSFNSTPHLELSTTHSTRLGTLGIVGLRLDARVRPPMTALGGTVIGETTQLTPAYYSGGVSVHVAIPAPKGVVVNGGIGIRGSYLEYVQYLAKLSIPPSVQGADPVVVSAGVDVGSIGIGPELTVGTGYTVKTGKSGIQFGIEFQSGMTVLRPASSHGTVTYVAPGEPFNGQEVPYELTFEGVLWGTHLGVLLFVRAPLL